jgi:hypothetical protein
VAHAVDDARVHQHEPISLEVDARFGVLTQFRRTLGPTIADTYGEILQKDSALSIEDWLILGAFSSSR